jgi:alpha-tubulin suppressor-like RCC1 family protein
MKRIARFVLFGPTIMMVLQSGVVRGAATVVTGVGAGAECSFFIRSDGSLWGMGYDYNGQLGNGTNTTTSPYGILLPEQIVASGVTNVTGGAEHSLFLKSDGSLWAMGYNPYGELGNGTFLTTNTPQRIVAGNVKAIAAGFLHSLFLKTDGTLWAMGDNTYGQLGAGNITGTNIPVLVASNVTAVAAGDYHSLFVTAGGALWAMGDNYYGQLGTGNNVSTNAPVLIVSNNVTAIAGGAAFSVFVESDGSLWTMGDNSNGQLGRGNFISTNRPVQVVSSNVTAIAAGNGHTLFRKADGSLWGMGYNSSGQLGDGRNADTNAPEMLVTSNVTAMAAGRYFSLFLTAGGTPSATLFAMGYNTDGELGDGTTTARYSPQQIVPAVQFTASPISGLALLTVQFNAPNVDNAGNPILQWNWNFGDGGTSTAQNPSHVYTNAGTYYPTLSVTNDVDSLVPARGAAIFVSQPTVQFTANPTAGIVPLPVQFNCPGLDSGSNAIVAWQWNFGDGTTSSEQNPSHIYQTNRTYFSSLSATNSNGTPVLAYGVPVIAAAYSGVVLNGDFEAGMAGWTNNSFFTSVASGPFYAHSGAYGLRLFQPGGAPAIFSQPLSTTIGQEYSVSFWLNSPDGAMPNVFRVLWNGATLLAKTNLAAIGWTNIQLTVTATATNSLLQFGFLTAPASGNGFGLDDVSVTPLVAPPLSIASIGLSGTNLVIQGANGQSNRIYCVLMSTNVSQSLSQWTPVATNVLGASGNFTFTVTNAVDAGASGQFYILQLR